MATRSREDLEDELAAQVRFLITSSSLFDAGDELEAKRLASTIRLLIHHTTSSPALLVQLGLVETRGHRGLHFLDSTPLPHFPGATSLGAQAKLCLLRVEKTEGLSEVRWIPRLDELPGPSRGFVPFENWWAAPIVSSQLGETFSRKRLAITVANKDGGAHVDPKLPGEYERLKTAGSMGYQRIDSGVSIAISLDREGEPVTGDLDLDPGPASIRQIAHEVLRTLQGPYGRLLVDYAPKMGPTTP